MICSSMTTVEFRCPTATSRPGIFEAKSRCWTKSGCTETLEGWMHIWLLLRVPAGKKLRYWLVVAPWIYKLGVMFDKTHHVTCTIVECRLHTYLSMSEMNTVSPGVVQRICFWKFLFSSLPSRILSIYLQISSFLQMFLGGSGNPWALSKTKTIKKKPRNLHFLSWFCGFCFFVCIFGFLKCFSVKIVWETINRVQASPRRAG